MRIPTPAEPAEDDGEREPGEQDERRATAGETAEQRESRHRRRRGRRGGRRNRRGRNGEMLPAGSEGEPESAPRHAVEDLDRPPANEESLGEEAPAEPAQPSQPAYEPPPFERPGDAADLRAADDPADRRSRIPGPGRP